MPKSSIDLARTGQAPRVTRCVILGEGADVRIAFLSNGGESGPDAMLSAVTLTRAQLTGLVGMLSSVLDSDDQDALSIN
ncbi:hypothetical protein P7D22_14985 [Lichenihabitans sp. Uapishka_5]|uniref:hypothetical protein n=1 Tax=Lichenihabitans sp. Uapishka_5 TaxID=3037302 RepID=UPI0029E7E4C4|nr:hypothetical protein [Lichenihabitans sp. Uapishka_5]MDX7952472.1 hypothetical protein [Lichenihabitans sp. Uapishka_5]